MVTRRPHPIPNINFIENCMCLRPRSRCHVVKRSALDVSRDQALSRSSVRNMLAKLNCIVRHRRTQSQHLRCTAFDANKQILIYAFSMYRHSQKHKKTKWKKNRGTKNRMCLNVITICGKFKFIAIQCSALSRAQRTNNSKCKRSRRHKWVCGDGKRLFALCGGCVVLVNALLLAVTFRRCFENSQWERTHFDFILWIFILFQLVCSRNTIVAWLLFHLL